MSEEAVKKARYFVDVELGRIMGASLERLSTIVDLQAKSSSTTVGSIVDAMAEELRTVSDIMSEAIKDFRDVNIKDTR